MHLGIGEPKDASSSPSLALKKRLCAMCKLRLLLPTALPVLGITFGSITVQRNVNEEMDETALRGVAFLKKLTCASPSALSSTALRRLRTPDACSER